MVLRHTCQMVHSNQLGGTRSRFVCEWQLVTLGREFSHPPLYLLPKIHKPGIPSYRTVSSFSSPNECVCVYMNVHLQPYANSPLLCPCTKHFLDMIRSCPHSSNLIPSWPLLISPLHYHSLETRFTSIWEYPWPIQPFVQKNYLQTWNNTALWTILLI